MKRFCLAITLVLATAALSAQGIYLTSDRGQSVRYHHKGSTISPPGYYTPVINDRYEIGRTHNYIVPTNHYRYSVSTLSVGYQSQYSSGVTRVGASKPSSVMSRRKNAPDDDDSSGGVRDPNNPGLGVSSGFPGNDEDYDPDNPDINVGGAPWDDNDNYDPNNPQFGPIGDGLWFLLLLALCFIVRRYRRQRQ